MKALAAESFKCKQLPDAHKLAFTALEYGNAFKALFKRQHIRFLQAHAELRYAVRIGTNGYKPAAERAVAIEKVAYSGIIYGFLPAFISIACPRLISVRSIESMLD